MAIEKIAIENRDQWLALRSQDVTASIAGALLGVHPYSTAYGLYLLKKGLIAEDPEETAPMQRGRLLEPVAAQLLREQRPDWRLIVHPVGYYFRDTDTRIGATPDVLAVDEKGRAGVVQIKSIEPSIFRRDWKSDDGSIEPPLWIIIQAIIEAHLTGAEWAAVAPLVVGFGLEMPIVPIPIHAGIIDRLKFEVAGFWQRIEEGKNYDPDYGRDGALIAKLYPQDNGAEIDLSGDNEVPEIVECLENARKHKKDAGSQETTAKAMLSAKMGAASFARLADGRRISFKTTHRAGYFVDETSFRVLRVLKGR
ncbi:YqaJ viral recombinase family protein [Bradyrhizobium lablabi]|uniref:YqaJ viral recombinase family nuclease n=1 Tax=Bradyrhizobium lablabi TaxID=722472 RepID=UPI001BAAC542|nr:YqaJ viral recombinase family protein [Bradyrhizobium lablabi]MBR0693612.1 YqaJ viral recombinase family protein [Bradyrhizobium lablabi]